MDFFQQCANTPLLVNTSRGKVVSIPDLVKALNSGLLSGACLDVLENENPGSYSVEEREMYKELFELQNVFLSPHIAGWTHESLELIARTMLEKIRRLNLV